ncbi:MAG: hypothetical protein K9L25_14405 [Methylovulum sp.]|jgi:hypothetical protein|nr:hypothetical protein [Methylovulum sp.]
MNEIIPTYTPIPHICKYCLGRLMQRLLDNGNDEYYCPDCEATAEGDHPSVLCICGFAIRTKKPYRCIPNPDRAPYNPVAYVAHLGR